ncbi:hypothetical protein [Rubripirellula obstinata]|uniref:hypothetical protein n=1 Tax=Rubripirellula obstinata TaxID=406547 RepID=UPI000829B342|nr:hypothetical protein [Rubripirellula obstinata]
MVSEISVLLPKITIESNLKSESRSFESNIFRSLAHHFKKSHPRRDGSSVPGAKHPDTMQRHPSERRSIGGKAADRSTLRQTWGGMIRVLRTRQRAVTAPRLNWLVCPAFTLTF